VEGHWQDLLLADQAVSPIAPAPTAKQPWVSANFGGEGEIEWRDGSLTLPMGSPLTGIVWPNAIPRFLDYQLEVTASRLSGNDFFCGLTFPVDDSHATVVLGGWGGGLCGLSCVDDEDAGSNATRSYQSFAQKKRYTLLVEVSDRAIRAWLDGELLFEQATADHKISLRTEMLPSQPLGIASFMTRAAIHSVRWRPMPMRAVDSPIDG
jgi:hypothetical protein